MDITLSLCGEGAGGLAEELDAAGIEYKQHIPLTGKIYASAGDILRIAQESAPYATLAAILIAWIRARSSRLITVTTEDHKVVYVKGYSVEEFEKLLTITSRVDAIDTAKPEKCIDQMESSKLAQTKKPRR